MPAERTPVQAAWHALDRVASELDRTALRRTHMSWDTMTRLATLVRDARAAYDAAVPNPPEPSEPTPGSQPA